MTEPDDKPPTMKTDTFEIHADQTMTRFNSEGGIRIAYAIRLLYPMGVPPALSLMRSKS